MLARGLSRVFCLCFLYGLTGCSVQVPQDGEDQGRKHSTGRYYLGLVHVQDMDSEQGKVRRQIVETVGFRLRDGVSLGWMKEDLVLVPDDCVVIILPREPGAAQDWINRLELGQGMEGARLCMGHAE